MRSGAAGRAAHASDTTPAATEAQSDPPGIVVDDVIGLHNVAVDPAGDRPTEAEDQPVDGYASETEADVPKDPECDCFDDGAENEAEPDLEETEALVHTAEAAPGTAATCQR